MAHYAFLDENNIVTEVIVGVDEDIDGVDWEAHYASVRGQTCKRTSYNTRAGVHTAGGEPFRKNYAGIGYSYNANLDAFIPPKPYSSWTLDEETANWKAPTPRPDRNWEWDENTLSWVERYEIDD
jgi:hypothetical protein